MCSKYHGHTHYYQATMLVTVITLRSLLGTNFCDLEKFAKFKDRKTYAVCASGAALYSMRTLRAH